MLATSIPEGEASGTQVNLVSANSLRTGARRTPISPPSPPTFLPCPGSPWTALWGPTSPSEVRWGTLPPAVPRRSPRPRRATSSLSAPGHPRSASTDYPDQTAFILQPRIGVATPVGERAAIWLRGGITYFHATSEGKMTRVSDSGVHDEPHGDRHDRWHRGDARSGFGDSPSSTRRLTLGPAIDIGVDGSTEVAYSGLSG